MKGRHFMKAIIILISTAILLSSCGDIFLDPHYANADITAVRDPNTAIQPRMKRIPQPEITQKVTAKPEDFEIGTLLNVLHNLDSSIADREYPYTMIDLKQTPMLDNKDYAYDKNEVVGNISSKVEGESYILTYTYNGIQYTFIQDPYGRLTLSFRTDPDNSEVIETWITGTDGSHWWSRSEWNGRYYYEGTDNEESLVRSYRLDDQDPLRREYNIYSNGMTTELHTGRFEGKVTDRRFISRVEGREDSIDYTRTATTNEDTGKLIGYDVELSGYGAREYAERNLEEILGFDIQVREQSEVLLGSDTFSWKLKTEESWEEISKLLRGKGFNTVIETERKLNLEKGDTVVELLKNPGVYSIKFTFPIEDLPAEFRR